MKYLMTSLILEMISLLPAPQCHPSCSRVLQVQDSSPVLDPSVMVRSSSEPVLVHLVQLPGDLLDDPASTTLELTLIWVLLNLPVCLNNSSTSAPPSPTRSSLDPRRMSPPQLQHLLSLNQHQREPSQASPSEVVTQSTSNKNWIFHGRQNLCLNLVDSR